MAKLDRKRKRTSCNRQAALEEKVEEIAAQVGREPKRKDRGTSESTLPAVKDETPGLVTIAPKSASAPAAPAPATVKPAEKEAPLSALSASSASSVGGTPMASRSASLPAAPFQDIGIGDDECAEALARFMNEQSDHCPWVQLPKGTTAPGLRDQKPLLFLGIMLAASYHDFDVQQKICKTALHYVSDQLIVHGNKSIALLQGLLVLLNWYQSQFLNPQATVTNLLHLSIALTTDLGLNQNPTSLANQRLLQHSLMSFMNGGRRGGVQSSEQMGGAGGAGGKSMEDRRALVGTFYISMGIVFNSSPTSSHAMGWSPMLEEAAQALHESGLAGNRADLRLAKMCRLQQINAEIDQVQRELTLADKPLPSLALYIKPFEVRLEQFWLDMPLDFRKDGELFSFHLPCHEHAQATNTQT